MSEIPVVRKLGLVATVAMTLMLAASPSVVSSTPRTSTTAAQAQDVDSVYFLNPRVGWASVDSSARLLMTTDGGAHWRDVSPPMLKRKGLALANGLAGAAFLSPSDFFVSVYESEPPEGFRPVFLLHTTDGGRKWTEVGSFPGGVGTAWVSFQNDQQGWVAIGNGAAGGTFTVTIYETTSGGAHWVMVSRSMSAWWEAWNTGQPKRLRRHRPRCSGNLACARSLAHRVFRKCTLRLGVD